MLEIINRIFRFRRPVRLKAVNLALSADCNADCIFCPSVRAGAAKQRMMPLGYVEKILKEITSPEFAKKHDIRTMSISQNGEAFLNKELISILRLIRKMAPRIKVRIFTNFSHFSKEKAEIILGENLIQEFDCNIDGSSEANYFSVKKLDYKNTRNNIAAFLETRKRLNVRAPLTIWALTLHSYIHGIYGKFGFYPEKMTDPGLIAVPDDFELIKEEYEKMLDPLQDRVVKSDFIAWSERKRVDAGNIDYSKYACPVLSRVREEAFISPDGTWYACNHDAENILVLGNVVEESIEQVFNCEKRRKLIDLLERKQFGRIDGPCRTVVCCQVIR